MTHEDTSQARRSSLYRQLSDVLKLKRKSFYSNSRESTLSSTTTTPSPSSTFTFLWNCALTEVDTTSKEDFDSLSNQSKNRTDSIDVHRLMKQKSISYDDLVFISSNEDGQTIRTNTINHKLKLNETTNRLSAKTSGGKERNEKRNSMGSTILSLNSKSISKRSSNYCMMLDNDENQDSKILNQQPIRTNKTSRPSIFASSIFTRDVNDTSERSENNLAFIRRKCDEWLTHGLPKLAQLHFSIDECDLFIEKEWQPFLNEQSRTLMSETIKLQQEAIYEMLSTEVSYIRQILTMTDIFMTSISILKSSQRDGIFHDIDMDKLFSNIQDVLHGNLLFWKEILLPIKIKLQQSGLPMNPSDLKNGFINFDIYFQPYLHYVLDQKMSAEYFKQKFSRDDLFQYLITWIEANFTNRLSFADLTIKPLQRLTRYKLLLEAIQKKTLDIQQKNDLQEMIQKVATFVNRVNSKLHNQEQEERIRQINDRIGPYENVLAPPELSFILQEYNRDSMSNRLNLLQDMPLHVRGYRRQIIQQGPMKMKDSKNNQDVYCYLFSDMFLITKGSKRTGSTNSSISIINNDGQTNRTTSNTLNKILKPPIRIDRIDVREYDRRGGNSSSNNTNIEPNTASFVAIIFSEYNLIESAYLFQTNLSKQWIENIRRTKANFHLLMEESKIKFQNIHNTILSSCCSTSTNTIHQSLPSLSLPLIELPNLKINNSNSLTNNIRHLSKVESNVFKIVEQTRRNSRTDRKNFGRYFTADGTSTHGTTPLSPSPIKQMLSSSTTIIKRMSWNNDQIIEKNDSSLITNSFRSVHSSSGVSSTGSFLFSTDEDSSITTTSSIPSIVPSIKNDEYDEKSLASTVIEIDDQLIPSSLIIQQQNLISEDLIKNNLENKNNEQLITQISPSSTSTLISNNQTIFESQPSIITDISSPESSLRRIPYPSVRKRNQTHYRSILHQQPYRQNKISNDNDIESSKSTDDNNITNRIIHSPIDDSLLFSSGNESDYDNNDQCMTVKIPVNDHKLIRIDDKTHIENLNINNNQQSDTTTITSKDTSYRANRIISINPVATLDDSEPISFQPYRQDSITARRLLDIRSHLLLNTTLDATEV
ncbi:unnamed protein product [Rotaria sordida]|uniref:DH domain-containing protein n=1 Tax=Rotaria sordida TaxID=392033 RepID=A0A814EYF0_9BILA|nr:unnamed protein product [Rotaria sordida]CAF1187829.1 unnamed protein product [Rotaria sordida]